MRKREGLFYNWQRIVAAILIVAVSMTSLSFESLARETGSQEELQTEDVQEMKDYEVGKDNVIESESTENSTTYDIGDGLRVTEFYAQDVRFRDEEGELVDYDASLVEVNQETSELGNMLDSYAYENKEGDMKHYFPENLTEETPLLMEKGEKQIRFVPMEATVQFQVPETQPVHLLTEKVEDIYTEEEMEPILPIYLRMKM